MRPTGIASWRYLSLDVLSCERYVAVVPIDDGLVLLLCTIVVRWERSVDIRADEPKQVCVCV
jgi:hypothetical protein